MKENKIIIRLEKDFSDNYFEMCKNKGYTMSKRVRRLMELDIELDKLNVNSIEKLKNIL